MTNNDVAAFLKRQFEFLSEQKGRAYFRQTKRWLSTLSMEPRVRQHLADMENSANTLVREHWSEDEKCVEQLVALVQRIVATEPSFRTPTLTDEQRQEQVDTQLTFDRFDKVAKEKPRAVEPREVKDGSRTADLLPILEFQLKGLMYPEGEAAGNRRPEMAPFWRELTTIHDTHRYAYRELLDSRLTHGGMALLELKRVFRELNPEPTPTVTPDDAANRWLDEQVAEVTPVGATRRALYSANHGVDMPPSMPAGLPTVHGDIQEQVVTTLQPLVRRLHEELVMRIGTRQSLLALVHRFKERCEWHDRERLRSIASQARKARRKPEDALTAEFARWLFDQGFSPLTEAKVGAGLKPDLLDPARLYVEAKRYKGSRGRGDICNGAKQVYSTVQNLRGTKYAIEEALFVIFRESGPLYLLPETVQCGDWVMVPVLIDIAPPSETGRREREQPIEITAEELAPQRSE